MSKSHHHWLMMLLAALMLLSSTCTPRHSIAGKWRTVDQAHLLFQYLEDGTVLLLEDHHQYPIFRYQVVSGHIIKLYDGMGRMRQYDFRVSGDTLTFYSNFQSGEIAETLIREKP